MMLSIVIILLVVAKFQLTEKELGFYDNQGKWMLEKGEFEVYVGGNSQTQNKKSFELK